MIAFAIFALAILPRRVKAQQDAPGPAPVTMPTTAPAAAADEPTVATPDPWPIVAKALGLAGTLHDGVYTVSVPRKDLEVHNENGDIPVAAGLSSEFHFYRCPCGKMNVLGQFVVADYEANDVVDALRKDPAVKVTSMGPMLMGEKPRLLLVRFQGEGTGEGLAERLKDALSWTGDARMTTQPVTH